MNAKPRPQAATIRRVVEHLEKELGLSIYGSAIDIKTGQKRFGCMDYDVTAILLLRKLVRAGKVRDPIRE